MYVQTREPQFPPFPSRCKKAEKGKIKERCAFV